MKSISKNFLKVVIRTLVLMCSIFGVLALADSRGLTLVSDQPHVRSLGDLAQSDEFKSTYRALIIGNNS